MAGFGQFSWIIFVGVTAINGVIFWHRGMTATKRDREKRARFERFFKGFMIAMLAPWIAVAIASMFGGLSAFDMLSQPHTNPFILLFDATMVAVCAATIKSVYFGDGAEMLSYLYTSGYRAALYSPSMIKVWVGVMLLGGLLSFIFSLNRQS